MFACFVLDVNLFVCLILIVPVSMCMLVCGYMINFQIAWVVYVYKSVFVVCVRTRTQLIFLIVFLICQYSFFPYLSILQLGM